MTNTNRNWTG